MEAGQVETGDDIQMEADQVETDGIQTESGEAKTCGIQIEAGLVETGSIKIGSNQVESGGIQTEASKVETCGIHIEATQIKTGGIQIEAIQVETGRIQTEASQVEAVRIQTEASQVEAGGIQIEASQVETGGIQIEASQVETGIIQIEASNVETGGIQTEAIKVETVRIQTEASQVETGGIQIESSQVETGGIQIESSQVETGRIQTEASQVETGGIQIEVSQVETGGIQIEVSQVETGGIQTKASQVETGGIQTEASQVETGRIQTEASQVVTGGIRTEASQVETGGIQTEACRVETEASQVETGGIQTEACQVETEASQVETGGIQIEASQVETGGIQTEVGVAEIGGSDDKTIETSHVLANPPARAEHVDSPKFVRTVVSSAKKNTPSVPKFCDYESRLRGYCNKVGIKPPVYETIIGGPSHKPFYRSSVTVDNVRYDSLPRFSSREAAEKSAAEVALSKLYSSVGMEFVISQPMNALIKGLLYEYTTSMNYAPPLYECIRNEEKGKTPMFSCIVEIRGIKYAGASAGTKKHAVTNAARTAMLAIHSATPSSENQTDNSADCVIPPKKVVPDLGISTEGPTAAAEPNKILVETQPRKRKKKRDVKIGTSGEGTTCSEVNTLAIRSATPLSESQTDKGVDTAITQKDLVISGADPTAAVIKPNKCHLEIRERKRKAQVLEIGTSGGEGSTCLEVNTDSQAISAIESPFPSSEIQMDKNEVPDLGITAAAKRSKRARKMQKQAVKVGNSVEGTTPLEVNMDIQDILPNQSAAPLSENQTDNIADNVITQKNEVPDPRISTEGPAAKRVDKCRRRKTKSQKQALKIGTSVEGTTPLEVNMDIQDILPNQSAPPVSENQADNIVDNVTTQKNEVPDPGISTEGPAAKRVDKRRRRKTKSQKQALKIGTSVEGTTPLEVDTTPLEVNMDTQDILATQSAAPLSENQTDNIVDNVITQKNEIPAPGISTEGPAAKRVKKRHRRKTETQKQALEIGTSVEGTTPLEVNTDIQDILANQSAAPLSENQTNNIVDDVITQKNEVPGPGISTEGPAAKRVKKRHRQKTETQKQALEIGTSIEGTTPLEVNTDIQDILANQSAAPLSENQTNNIVDDVITQKNEVPGPGISTEGPAAKRVKKRHRQKTETQKQALEIGTSVEGTTPLEVNTDIQDILANQSAAPLSENQTNNIVDDVITQKNEVPGPGISTEGPAAKRVKKRHRQKTETQKQALEIGTSVEGTTPLEVNTDIQDILANQSAAPLSENQTNNIVDDVITQKNEVPGPGISTEGPAAKRVKKRRRQKTETQKQALESGTSVEGTTSSAGPAVSAAIKPIKTSFKNQQWKENRQAFNRYASGVGTNSQASADSRIAGAVVPPHNGSSDFIPRTSQHHHIDQSPMTHAGMQREKISSDMDDRKPQYVTYPWVPPPINTIYYQNYSGLDMDLG